MAYQRWFKTVRDQQGNAINGASCTVYGVGTSTLATVYDPNSDDASPSPQANPFTTTSNGRFGFMAADGEYDVQISGGSLATQQFRVALNAANLGVVAADTLRSDLAATTGAGLVGDQAPYTGAVARTQADKNGDSVSVKDFGAVGDGATDDTTALIAAGSACAASGKTLVFVPTTTGYKITDTTTFPVGCNVDMNGAFITYAGPKDRPAVILGSYNTLNVQPIYRNIDVRAGLDVDSWSDVNYVGVRGVNFYRAEMVGIRLVAGFYAGWECYSDTKGYAYTSHSIGELLNNKFAMVLRTVGPELGGNFINENNFFGGRYGTDSSANAMGDAYGVLITWDKVAAAAVPSAVAGSSYRNHNNNKWWGPAFELNNPSTYVRVPFYFDGAGKQNQVLAARHESGRGPFAIIDGGTEVLTFGGTELFKPTQNKFECLWAGSGSGAEIQGVEELNAAANNYYSSYTTMQRFPMDFNSGNLVDKVKAYNSTLAYATGDVCFFGATLGVPSRVQAQSTAKTLKNELYLVAGCAIGSIIDTRYVKKWSASVNARAGFAGRVYIKCFDADGVVLSGATPKYVQNGDTSLVVSANYANSYGTGSDNVGNPISLTFHESVKSAQIMFTGGTNPLYIRSFTLRAWIEPQLAYGSPAVATTSWSAPSVSGGPGLSSGPIAPAIPSTAGVHGVYSRGEVTYHATAAVASPVGWQVTSVTPSFLGAAWVASTAYSIVGEVVVNGVNAYALKTAGTSAGATGPTTTTGADETDGTCVWNYVGKKAVFGTLPNLA